MMKGFDVRAWGAAGDGVRLDTQAIQMAIDACSGAGGGTVCFPNGRYLTGTLYMRSGVGLRFECGAILLGSAEIADYGENVHRQRYDGHAKMDRCLVYGEDLTDISFEGPGLVDGQGGLFPKGYDDPRPVLFRFLRCGNIRFDGLRIKHPGSWAVSLILCRKIFVRAVEIDSRSFPNGNGLVFDACRDMLVSDCRMDTSDDSICLQSSFKDEPLRGAVIHNCLLSSHYAGMKIGMLSLGDIEDVTVSNCVLHDMGCSGFKIQSAEGGSIRHLLFQNIVMRNVPRPIFITCNRHRVGIESPQEIPPSGRVSDISFDHCILTTDGAGQRKDIEGIVVSGVPGQEIEGLRLRSIQYLSPGGTDSGLAAAAGAQELGTQRPEAYAFGKRLPASALFMRHVRNARIEDLRIRTLGPDARPPVWVESARDIQLSDLDLEAQDGMECLVSIAHTQGIRLRGLFASGSPLPPLRTRDCAEAVRMDQTWQ